MALDFLIETFKMITALLIRVKTIRSSGVARVGRLVGQQFLLTRPLRIRENTHSVNAFGKAMAFLRDN